MSPSERSSEHPFRNRSAIVVMNVVLGAVGAGAVATLILEYGFRALPIPDRALHVIQGIIVTIFVLDRLSRLLLSRNRRWYLRENWIDFALIGVLLIILATTYQLRTRVVSLGALYVAIAQGYILVHLALRAVSMNLRFAGSKVHPTWLLIGSFLVLICVGTGLLMLERSVPVDKSPMTFVDALFTATSATCVTGLIVRDTGADFSPFGQGVILFLIQSGGLGIMLFGTVFALVLGKHLSVRGTSAMGQMLGSDRPGEIRRIAMFVVLITFAFEILGALLFYPMFTRTTDSSGCDLTTTGAIWNSAFHSISSFCNAGFSLYTRNMFQGVEDGWDNPLRNHWQVMGVMAPLIVLGGLGFPVLQDCARYVRDALKRLLRRLRRRRHPGRAHLTLHSRIVLTTSAVLIVLGAVVLLLVEPAPKPRQVLPGAIGGHPLVRRAVVIDEGDWAHLPRLRRTREAMFQSITARTAGFNTISMDQLSDSGKLWICWLMMIGGSPAGTAGGVKTVTVALLVLTAYCAVRKRNELEVFKRAISVEILRKAVTLAVLYMGLVAVITLLLCVTEAGGDRFTFIDRFFEACSACGTVGLSTGVTTSLHHAGKYVIVAGMFIGRLGPLTLLIALTSGLRHVRYSYPQENVVIG